VARTSAGSSAGVRHRAGGRITCCPAGCPGRARAGWRRPRSGRTLPSRRGRTGPRARAAAGHHAAGRAAQRAPLPAGTGDRGV